MADDNLPAPTGPVTDAPKTYDEQVEGLADLLDDSDTPNPGPDDDADTATEIDDDPDGLNEIEAEDVDAVDGDDTADDDDGQPEVKGGRFAPDTAKTTLDDGSVISIAELKGWVDKRVKDFQRDYTSKSQALSAKEKEVDQHAQSLGVTREYLASLYEQSAPKDPGPYWTGAADDYAGIIAWEQEKRRYDNHVQAYQTLQQQRQQEDQRKQAEQNQQRAERLRAEAMALQESYPILRDPVKGKAFLDATERDAAKYFGLEPKDLTIAAEDRRIFKALRYAIKQARLEAAPKAQQEVTRRPAMKGGKRAAPNAQVTRERNTRTERLRKTGSFDDGVAALMDFDL